MPAVWERSHVRQLYRNTLTTDFAQVFQNDHNNIWMLWTRSVSWLVKLSRLIAQSHMTFSMRMEEFIR